MEVLRKTKNYTVTGNGNTITIQVNEGYDELESPEYTFDISDERQRKIWESLNNMNDDSFDRSCVFEIGIGTYYKEQSWQSSSARMEQQKR